MAAQSRKAVIYAIFGNGILTVLKFFAATISNSASMMNEAVHSLMDTLNQLFLYAGIKSASRPADEDHAFGYGQTKYLWNLWSAIGLFSVGAGFGLRHAWHALHADPNEPIGLLQEGVAGVPNYVLSLAVLLISAIVEGYVLKVAIQQYEEQKIEGGFKNFKQFAQEGDPTLLAVLLEDSVALIGVFLAALGVMLVVITHNPIWDVLFSAIIAVLLGVVAFFLGMINMRYLTGVRDTRAEEALVSAAKEHAQVENIYDLRSIVLDESHTVLVAEVEMREEAIVNGLGARIDAIEAEILEGIKDRHLTEDVKEYVASRAVVQATLERTEEIIDELEVVARERCRRISHVTIEVQGIANDHEKLATLLSQ